MSIFRNLFRCRVESLKKFTLFYIFEKIKFKTINKKLSIKYFFKKKGNIDKTFIDD